MVFPWFPHGFPMVSPWFSHGFPWFSHGFPMVFPWFSHGFPMVFPWFSHVSMVKTIMFPVFYGGSRAELGGGEPERPRRGRMAAAPRGTWDPVAPGECGAGAARRGRGSVGWGGTETNLDGFCVADFLVDFLDRQMRDDLNLFLIMNICRIRRWSWRMG